MRIVLREDSEGVASTVATLFTLLAVVLFMQAAIVAVIPAKQNEAERNTTVAAIAAFDMLRSAASGAVFPGGQVTVTIPIGTPAVSPFSSPSPGDLQFNMGDSTNANISVQYVPTIHDSHVSKVDQDIILAIDGSGSMSQNDPNRLRIQGGKDYISRLSLPDRVASVAFTSVAYLIRTNVGGPAHHLFSPYNNGLPNYSGAQSDLDTIGQTDGTNFGAALQVANDELIANGLPNRAWVIILLTDGFNNYPWQDTLALAQAGRAKANNITVYTIGLGAGADAALLTDIADITGGTYFAAPTADSIRWIYFEISMHYRGTISCGTLSAASTVSGSLSLNLANRQYPAQTIRLEAGGVTVTQPPGTLVQQGMPVSFTPRAMGAGTLQVTLLTFTGPAFEATGTDYQFLTARFLQHTVGEQVIIRPDLVQQSSDTGNISDYVKYWATQGAATPAGAKAVTDPLQRAQARINWSQVNLTSSKLTPAKFNVDSAQNQLSAAIDAAEQQVANGQMQRWLATSAEDLIRRVSCQLSQWQDWYGGVKLTIQSPTAAAWAIWFDQTFRPTGALISLGTSGTNTVLSVNAIDRFIIDERVIELSFG
jgi:von Willebrand factor type A domain